MSAVISKCKNYRYLLNRKTSHKNGKKLVFVMLNPSTADASKDDPTIRKCIGFGERLGYEDVEVVNLFAFRSTKPENLLTCDDPVGPSNDEFIGHAINTSDMVICAWGTKGSILDRDKEFLSHALNLHALEITKDGHPKHPLYISYDKKPVPFNISVEDMQ